MLSPFYIFPCFHVGWVVSFVHLCLNFCCPNAVLGKFWRAERMSKEGMNHILCDFPNVQIRCTATSFCKGFFPHLTIGFLSQVHMALQNIEPCGAVRIEPRASSVAVMVLGEWAKKRLLARTESMRFSKPRTVCLVRRLKIHIHGAKCHHSLCLVPFHRKGKCAHVSGMVVSEHLGG